jgi:hypothetical protein
MRRIRSYGSRLSVAWRLSLAGLPALPHIPREILTRLARRRHNLFHALRPANVVEAFANKRMTRAAT